MHTSSNPHFPEFSARQIDEATAAAYRFMGRWDDGYTVSYRDEISHDAVVTGLLRWPTLRDKGCLHAFIRTIARRRRAVLIAERMAQPTKNIADHRVAELLVDTGPSDPNYLIAGEWLSRQDLVEVLPDVMRGLTRLNAELLMGYYAGHDCHTLADRHGMAPHCVKVRIHRSRGRLEQLLKRHLRRLNAARVDVVTSDHRGAAYGRADAAPPPNWNAAIAAAESGDDYHVAEVDQAP